MAWESIDDPGIALCPQHCKATNSGGHDRAGGYPSSRLRESTTVFVTSVDHIPTLSAESSSLQSSPKSKISLHEQARRQKPKQPNFTAYLDGTSKNVTSYVWDD